jgi:hypothetical protein
MENSNKAQKTDLKAEPTLEGYDSMILQLYTKNLTGLGQELQIMDIGPICEENIWYFSQRVKRCHVCDMFIIMERGRLECKSISTIWDHLDYPLKNWIDHRIGSRFFHQYPAKNKAAPMGTAS